MSYGIGIVILKEDLNKDKIRYDFCDWMLPIIVQEKQKTCEMDFKKRWYPDLLKEKKTTTLDILKTAPCDCVCIIDEFGNFDLLKGRTPISSLNIELKKYLDETNN